MAGAIELLTKLASVGKVTIEKATELGESIGQQLASGAEGTADSVGGKTAAADKTMAYIMDKATPGMGQRAHEQEKDKADMGMEM